LPGQRRRVPTIDKEDLMALARVVSFEGVSKERMDSLVSEVRDGDRPDDLPATEMLILHDPNSEKSLAIVFFDSEDDYSQGDATLSAMPADETPGRRTAVAKYDVALRMTV
jgi:hypothetical protein